MSTTSLDPLDRVIAECDAALRTVLATPGTAARRSPAAGMDEPTLGANDRVLGARLMRVNHAGEIAAQALYRGQALVARDGELRAELLRAAREEHDHLAWCAERTRELGSRVSVLAPAWYLGALAIGALAGLRSDRVSLGFLAETERQVAEHLEGHLQRLPAADQRSRAIIGQMRSDELAHRDFALTRGAAELPAPARGAMRLAARVMTTVAHFL